MRLLSVIIGFLIFLSSFSWAQEGQVEELILFDDVAHQALEQVNAFRQAPLLWAKENGLLFEEITPLWEPSELSAFEQGLSPLTWNESLANAARKHLLDLIQSLSSQTFPALTPEERASFAGYAPLLVGQGINVLLFEHFISPEEALKILLQGLFRDALKKETAEGAPFLFPYEDLGAALAGGRLVLEGKAYNFYALCVYFGLSKQTGAPLLVGRVYEATSHKPLPSAELFLLRGFWIAGLKTPRPDGTFFFLRSFAEGESLLLVARKPDGKVLKKSLVWLPPQRVDLVF